jgi:hypothetical protein
VLPHSEGSVRRRLHTATILYKEKKQKCSSIHRQGTRRTQHWTAVYHSWVMVVVAASGGCAQSLQWVINNYKPFSCSTGSKWTESGQTQVLSLSKNAWHR